jgi:hypothetical protein
MQAEGCSLNRVHSSSTPGTTAKEL